MQNSHPAVSVLMPCYNAAQTLREALDSLHLQTLDNFEIVVVDDGSTDDSWEILQSFSQIDSRLRVIHQPHSGIIHALNTGLQHCRADWVARMDADDRSRPERLALQAGFLDAHPETAVVGSRVTGFPTGQVREGFEIYIEWLNSLLTDEQIRREIFVESPLVHPSVMFRRDWVARAGGYQEHGWAEDYDLWLRLYLLGAQFAKLPQVLLDWREHPERITRTDGRYSLENFLRAKAEYLARGPLAGCDGIIIWGAGMVGRRLGKQLMRQGVPVQTYIDIDPRKIGRTRHGRPVLAPEALFEELNRFRKPALLAAVGARGARRLIRARLEALGLREGQDWWSAA